MSTTLTEPAPPHLAFALPSDTGVATVARGSRHRRSAAFYAAGVLVTAGAAALGARHSGRVAALAGGGAALLVALVRSQRDRWFSDEPDYEVVGTLGPLEIRQYAPCVEARTEVTNAGLDQAMSEGFRRLAGYIFGGNVRREAVAMTTPVIARGQAIAMTTPVLSAGSGGGRLISFVMEPGHTRASLPAPTDARVELVDVPARRVAVLRFRGRHRGGRMQAREDELIRLVAKHRLVPTGAPVFAGFDPPWVLGALRRNELWVELAA